MDELIRIKNEGYAEYEDLLLKRDKLRKEAQILQGLYMAEFGDLITAVFQKKIDCIQKKKTIAFCQASINRGEPVNQDELQAHLKKEMQDYQKRLKEMVEENEAAHQMTSIDDASLVRIKKLYRKMAKLIHPDINPQTKDTPELQGVWNLIQASYNANDLKELEEAEVMLNQVLTKLGLGETEIDIPDIQEKIKVLQEEIIKIKTTNPYQYKYLLEDKDAVREKKETLNDELKEYEEYEKELGKYLEQLVTENGITFIWRMK